MCLLQHAAFYGLSGALPTELGLLSSLTHLNLCKCGRLLGVLFRFSSIFLTHNFPCHSNNQTVNNDLSGTVPTQITQLTGLVNLILMNNPRLTGNPLTTLSSMPSLRGLQLYNCDFGGTLPTELGNMKDINYLRLGMRDEPF